MATPEEMKEYNDFLLQAGSTSNVELEKMANELLSAGQAPSAVEETRAIGKQIASSLMEELKNNGFMKLAEDPSINPTVLVGNNIDKKDEPGEAAPKPKADPNSLVAQIMATIGAVAEKNIAAGEGNAEEEEDVPNKKETEEELEEKAASELIAKVASELVGLGISAEEAPEAAKTLLEKYVEAVEGTEPMTAEGSDLDALAAYYELGREVGSAILSKISQ